MQKQFESQMLQYIVNEYYGGDSGALAKRSGYSKQQIDQWHSGKTKPQKATLRWLLSTTIAPEFKVVCEFGCVAFNTQGDVKSELKRVLNGQGEKVGVYAFYDSMCNLIYLGKASTNIMEEMYQQLIKPLGLAFPKAVKQAPSQRWEATRYVSAYEIPHVDHLDYPKHVEALFLRLAKPIGNKVLGSLAVAVAPKEK